MAAGSRATLKNFRKCRRVLFITVLVSVRRLVSRTHPFGRKVRRFLTCVRVFSNERLNSKQINLCLVFPMLIIIIIIILSDRVSYD